MAEARLVIYQDQKREWRWRFVAANGRILADSGEGYAERNDALTMARRLFGVPYAIEEQAPPDAPTA